MIAAGPRSADASSFGLGNGAVTIDTKTFRNLIGGFATGVTVVTTNNDGWLHGLTANAVSSLSLDPMLLLICVDKGGRSHEELTKASAFAVNILAQSQASVSNTFAKSGEPEQGTLRGVAFREGSSGAPLIEGANVQIECESFSVLDGGDHTIFVGRVVAAEEAAGASAPLLYYKGAYASLAMS
jgi:flavin reductase (DIM6/NTAB) family NADH-FMN oxidoreductase RutF